MKKMIKRFIVATVGLTLVSTVTRADVLDFEDFPMPPGYPNGSDVPAGPLFSGGYQGFVFSALHDAGMKSSAYDNTWAYYQLNSAAQNNPYNPNWSGLWWGISSGEFALTSLGDWDNPQWDPPSYWEVARADGGLFSFDGAMFTTLMSYANGISVKGYIGDAQVLSEIHTIGHSAPTLVTPTQQTLVDRIRLRGVSSVGGNKGFIMDDFQYTLVPTPGACVLLLLSGVVMRARRRV